MSVPNMSEQENAKNFHDFNYDESKQIFEQVVDTVINLKKCTVKAVKTRANIEEIIRRKKEGNYDNKLYSEECNIVKTNDLDTLCRVFRISNSTPTLKVQQILSINEIFNVLSELHMSVLPTLGLEKSLERLNDYYIEPIFIRAFLKSCKDCKNDYKYSSSSCTQGCKKAYELIIFDISPTDNDFSKVLLCFDRTTSFVWLKPLKTDEKHEVALELLTIICDFGLPNAFYSKQIDYFVEVIDILKKLMMPIKFPRVYTTCLKVMRYRHHIKGLIENWTETNNGHWLVGIHIIQWLINTNNAIFPNSRFKFRVTEDHIDSPYHAMFGVLPNEELLKSKFISKSALKPRKISKKTTVTCSQCTKPIYKVYKCHYCKKSCHITCCVRTVDKNVMDTLILISKCMTCVNDIRVKKL